MIDDPSDARVASRYIGQLVRVVYAVVHLDDGTMSVKRVPESGVVRQCQDVAVGVVVGMKPEAVHVPLGQPVRCVYVVVGFQRV